MTSIRLLGLDIGGTSSRARVVVDGAVVAEAQAASASLTAAGSDSAAAALAELLAQLPLDDPFDAVCAGSAGSNVPGAEEFLADRLAPLTRTGTVIVVNDAMLVLPAAGLDEGVAVICGTGSIAVGKAADLALVDGDPSVRIGDLRHTRIVMMDGKLMDADALRAAVGVSARPAWDRGD